MGMRYKYHIESATTSSRQTGAIPLLFPGKSRRQLHLSSRSRASNGRIASGWRRGRLQEISPHLSQSTKCTWGRGGRFRLTEGESQPTGKWPLCSPDILLTWIFPCGVPSGHGAPFLRLVGLPDYRILCPDQQVWQSGGSDVPHRLPSP